MPRGPSKSRRDGPRHTSYSARETLLRCPRSYYLRYFTEAPRRPAIWSIGGSAVHDVTEQYDLQSVAEDSKDIWSPGEMVEIWTDTFERYYQEASRVEPNETKWGQGRTEPPAVWREIGLGFVQSYVDWRQRSNWEIWTTPDGEPAIELDVSGKLPGCPVEIKAYIDRIFWDPTFEKLWIVDLKAGKKPPTEAAQLDAYAALTEVKYGVRINDGVHFLNRRATTGKPFDLKQGTPERVGKAFGEAWKRMQRYKAEHNWPATKDGCVICDSQESCHAIGGPLAKEYDPELRVPF